MVFLPNRSGKSNRNGGFYHRDGIRIILDDQLDDRFHSRSIEEILLAVVIGRGSNDHDIRILISLLSV